MAISLWQIHSLFAQALRTQYSIPEGMQIEQLWEDQSGMVWIASKDGLYHFDGIQWESVDDQQEKLYVSAWGEDGLGNMWIGGGDGKIGWIDGHQFHRFNHPDFQTEASISGLVFDRFARLWIATYGDGLYCIQRDQIHHWVSVEEIPSPDIYALAIDERDHIWLGTDRGLAIFAGEQVPILIHTIGSTEGLPDPLVTSLVSDPHKGIWLGMYDGGLAYIASPDSMLQLVSENWNLGRIHQLKIHDGHIWMATEKRGLMRCRITGGVHVEEIDREAHTSFLIDQEGNLWIPDEQQISLIPLGFSRYLKELGVIRAAIPTHHQEGLWLGTEKGVYFASSKLDSLHVIAGTESLHVLTLFEDEHHRLWMGTMGDGLWRYDPNLGTISPFFTATGDIFPHVLSITGKGNQVWLATFGGAYRCELVDGQERIHHYQEAEQGRITYTYQVFKDSQDRIWLATDSRGAGFWQHDDLYLIPELNDQSIYSIAEDITGRVWLSSKDSGLYYWQSNTIHPFRLPDADIQLPIIGMAGRTDSSLLLIHGNGIGILFPSSHSYIELGKAWDIPAMTDALNPICKKQDGSIWIGTQQGLIAYQPSTSRSRKFPEARITGLFANLESVDQANCIELNHDQNHIAIKYAGLWYQAPEQIHFQHRLLGLEEDWQGSRNYQASYPRLAPGSYTFELRVAPLYSTVGSEIEQLSFVVASPLWQRGWFLLLACLILAISLFAWIKYREGLLTRREQLEKQAIEYRFETLRNQINPHFLFNSFTTLIGMIEDRPSQAVDFVEKLADFFRHILDYRNRISIPLWEEKKLLDTYISLLKERFEDGFFFHWEVSEDLLDKKVPPLCLQVLVENVFKHNIVSPRSPLDISIYHIGSNTLVIKNNLQRRKRVQSSTQVGLQNLIDRYQLLSSQEINVQITQTDYLIYLPLLD